LQRVLAEHTYEHRARQVDAILAGRLSSVAHNK
jgi:spore maturation protein CgeB